MRYTEALTVRFEAEMLEELREVAERAERSVGSVIRLMLKQGLRRERLARKS